MKDLHTVRTELDAWYTAHLDDAFVPDLDEVEAILTGITPATFQALDASVDHYPYGWLVRRWRNNRFTKAIFA